MMARDQKATGSIKKSPRGLFQKPAKSGVWWINYYVDGKQHREKVGSKKAAGDLYRKRKEDARSGRKLPVLRNSRTVLLSELIDDALEYVSGHKDKRNYESKAEIVRESPLGSRPASEITPQELDRWLKTRKTNATSNRYKAFVSLCYREGISNGKVSVNPARLLRGKRERGGRLRFLSRDEYDRLCLAITARAPEKLSEFVISVHSGMRLSEQFTVQRSQVHFDRRTVELTDTKNGSARTVHLNSIAINALKTVISPGMKPSALIFGTQAKQVSVRHWFLPSLDDAKIEGYVWHANRHTFCSWLALAGASIKDIQEAAGHKNITMSARYAHLTPEHRLSVVERLAPPASE
jgi:integrase